jgi:hypothetical protein
VGPKAGEDAPHLALSAGDAARKPDADHGATITGQGARGKGRAACYWFLAHP